MPDQPFLPNLEAYDVELLGGPYDGQVDRVPAGVLRLHKGGYVYDRLVDTPGQRPLFIVRAGGRPVLHDRLEDVW
jgi:hypothetical protein